MDAQSIIAIIIAIVVLLFAFDWFFRSAHGANVNDGANANSAHTNVCTCKLCPWCTTQGYERSSIVMIAIPRAVASKKGTIKNPDE